MVLRNFWGVHRNSKIPNEISFGSSPQICNPKTFLHESFLGSSSKLRDPFFIRGVFVGECNQTPKSESLFHYFFLRVPQNSEMLFSRPNSEIPKPFEIFCWGVWSSPKLRNPFFITSFLEHSPQIWNLFWFQLFGGVTPNSEIRDPFSFKLGSSPELRKNRNPLLLEVCVSFHYWGGEIAPNSSILCTQPIPQNQWKRGVKTC